MNYSTDEFTAAMTADSWKAMALELAEDGFIAAMTADSWETMALELAENGWKNTGVINLYNSDEFGEFTFEHPDYEDPLVVATTDETSTDGLLRIILETRLLSPSKAA